MSLMKSVLPFLTNQTRQFSSGGIACSYFFGNFLLSSLLWYDFKILVKSRGGGKKKKKKTLWPLFMDGVQLPQGYSHFKEAVYFMSSIVS